MPYEITLCPVNVKHQAICNSASGSCGVRGGLEMDSIITSSRSTGKTGNWLCIRAFTLKHTLSYVPDTQMNMLSRIIARFIYMCFLALSHTTSAMLKYSGLWDGSLGKVLALQVCPEFHSSKCMCADISLSFQPRAGIHRWIPEFQSPVSLIYVTRPKAVLTFHL